MRVPVLLAAALVAALAAAPAGAASKPAKKPAAAASGPDLKFSNAQEYGACMALARKSPGDGFESALAWQARGGGEAAEHCAAVALIESGETAEGAKRMEALGTKMAPAQPALAAEILAQAGQAWLIAGDNKRAYAVQTAALKLAPKDVDLLVDRAVTLGQAKNYWEAIDDLNRAHDLAPNRADVLVYRGSAYRFVDSQELAIQDLDEAIQLDDRNPEAFLERGILRRLANDNDGARRDWLRVVTLAPGTPTAEAAQKDLEMLDLKAQ
jgi:tetratricopeptide (TPR) repeat protein